MGALSVGDFPPWMQSALQFAGRTLKYAYDWADCFEALLAQLDDGLLLEVLSGASSVLRDEAMKNLRLEAQWRTLKRKRNNTRDALRAILPQFRRALELEGSKQGSPGVLLLTWWGRMASDKFGSVPLGSVLTARQLLDRFAVAVEWVSGASEADVDMVFEQLERMESSPEVMTRIFAGLLKSAVDGADSYEMITVLPQWLKPLGTGRVEAAAPPPLLSKEETRPAPATVTPEQDTRASELVLAAPVPKPVHASAQVAPVPVAQPVTSEPVSPASGPESVRSALVGLRDLLSACQQLAMEADEALSRADFTKLSEIARVGSEARARVQVRLEVLGKLFLAREAGALPSLPDATMRERVVAELYLETLEEQLREAERRQERLLQAFKQEVVEEFEAVGLQPPLELLEARSRAEIVRIQAAWDRRLSDERLLQGLLSGPERALAVFEKTLPRERLQFYLRTHEGAHREPGANLARVLLQDPEALAQEQAAGLRLFSFAVHHLLKASSPLPPGAWATLGVLSGGRVARTLAELGLEELLASTPVELFHLEAFHQAIGGTEVDKLHPVLRQLLARVGVSRLPASERLTVLADLALQSREPTLLSELFAALVETEQPARAMLLAVLAAHSGFPVPDLAVSEALRRFSLLLADRDEASRELVRFCLQDTSWLTHEPDDVALLLYLVAATRFKAPYINLQYQQPGALRDAGQARPALVARWLRPEVESENAAEDRELRHLALNEARQALQEWDQALKKKSCYMSWNSAMDYQTFFNQRLVQALARVEVGHPPPAIEPDELINEAETRLGLLTVEGDALKAMREYITRQHRRLQLLHEAWPFIHSGGLREALARPEPDLRADLEEELRRLGGSPAIRYLYLRAIERA
jgi:hypothetical protein